MAIPHPVDPAETATFFRHKAEPIDPTVERIHEINGITRRVPPFAEFIMELPDPVK